MNVVGVVDVPAVAVAFEAAKVSFVGRVTAAVAAAVISVTTEAVVLRGPVVIIVVLVAAVVLSETGFAAETVVDSVAFVLAAVLLKGLHAVPSVAETVSLVAMMSAELNSY